MDGAAERALLIRANRAWTLDQSRLEVDGGDESHAQEERRRIDVTAGRLRRRENIVVRVRVAVLLVLLLGLAAVLDLDMERRDDDDRQEEGEDGGGMHRALVDHAGLVLDHAVVVKMPPDACSLDKLHKYAKLLDGSRRRAIYHGYPITQARYEKLLDDKE